MGLILNYKLVEKLYGLFFLTLMGMVFLFLSPSMAMDNLDLLPKGINSPSVKFGYMSGLDSRYTPNGDLMTLSDIKSIEFNVKTLSSLEPQIKDLVTALNSFSTENYGDKLSLGTLFFDVQPTISYWAMVHAWGITEKLTFGFGIPVIQYDNHVQVINSGSNINALKKQFSGVSAALDDALNRLSLNLVQAANTELESRGYKPLTNRSETFVGDVQLVGMYEFYREDPIVLLYKLGLGLPTGPKPDPTDLLGLDVFGQTAIDNILMASYLMDDDIFINQKLGYRYILPDQVDVFAPISSTETLSSSEYRETVNRKVGDSLIYGASINYRMSTYWTIAAGYEYQNKNKDQYTGSYHRNYSLLAENTDSVLHKTRIGFTYSTVKSYFAKLSVLPMMLELEISDTTSGINLPRQLLSEFSLMLFY